MKRQEGGRAGGRQRDPNEAGSFAEQQLGSKAIIPRRKMDLFVFMDTSNSLHPSLGGFIIPAGAGERGREKGREGWLQSENFAED